MRSDFRLTEFGNLSGFDFQNFGDARALRMNDLADTSGQTGRSFSAQSAPNSVELFDASNTSLGTFATIQAAVDAAGTVTGEVTIVVGDGTFNENVVIDRGDLTLLSVNGRGATTIMGNTSGSELGAIEIDPNANNVTIGAEGQGFTVVGINGNGAVEKAAVYLQGSLDNISIIDNEIVANGDAGLLSEFAATVTNVLIDGNEFSGQTFEGAQPGDEGFGNQFVVGNDVPRQLVTMGGGNGGGNTSNITFSNNIVSGTAGGISEDTGNPQGNTLVTIDAALSSIIGNEFTGDTARFATAIRARGPETDIIDNVLSGESRGIFVNNQGQPGTYAGNEFNGTAIDDLVFSMTQGDDIINGGEGNDVIGADDGNDTIDGGGGDDTVGYTGASGEYSVAFNPDGSVTITDNEPMNGDDGTDTLTDVETIIFSDTTIAASGPVQLRDGNGDILGFFNTIQDAIDAASAGFTVEVSSGTFTENVTVDKAITLVGANVGVAGSDGARGAESIIDGTVVVTAAATLDGFEFLNDTASPSSFFGVRVQGANDVSIANSVFFSAVANGADGDRAIYADTSATGTISITDNLFTGASEGKYSTASWERGIWSDGAAAQLNITGNTFSWMRTAMNLDGYDDATHNISNNTLTNGGSGISIGIPKTTTITGINNNTFTNVDTDFNIQNPTTGQDFDLVATNNTGGGTGADALIAVLATQGDDIIRGSTGDDFLRGNNGTDILVLTDGGGSAYNPAAFDFTGLAFANGSVSGTLIGPDGTDTIDTFEVFEVTNVNANGDSTFVVLDGMDLQAALDAAGPNDTITLEDGTVLDNAGNEVVEVIDGGGGSDGVVGTDGNDLIDSSGGNDTVDGGAGNDDIIGGSGGDSLFGGAGNDEIDGGSGNDVIGGGDGADTLSGGSGRDTFLIEAGKTAADADVITDFRSVDRIALADADGRDIVIQQVGSDTEILADGVLVATLLGVRANRVTNLVEYEGTPASIDAPSGRGRSRFRDDFDFDSFDFGPTTGGAMPMSMGQSMGTQVTFESIFGSTNQLASTMSGYDLDSQDDISDTWLIHGMTAMDDVL